MAVTAPLTVKSTKSMVAMQRLSPELKKMQQKYKGDRQTLNEEMMKLYKEHGVNPAGGCLPMVAQFPVFIILYGVIKGLANTITKNSNGLPDSLSNPTGICHQAICALPRYIGTNTKLYTNLVKSPGNIQCFRDQFGRQGPGPPLGGGGPPLCPPYPDSHRTAILPNAATQ